MKFLSTLLIAIVLNTCAFAQKTDLFFNLSIEQGLSDASVNSIVQDKYGYLWLGTENGLNKFDGYSINTYFSEKGLPDNLILTLFVDSKEILWIGTARGAVHYDFISDSFQNTYTKDLPATQIRCFKEDKKGNIYIGTNVGIYYWERTTNKLQFLNALFGLEDDMHLIFDILIYDDNTLYVSTLKKHFYRLDLKTKNYTTYHFNFNNISDCCLYTMGMQQVSDNEILIGTLSHGVLKFNINTGNFIHPKHHATLGTSKEVLFNSVRNIMQDHTGRFWIASNYYGLAEYIPQKDSVIIYNTQPKGTYNFEGNNAQILFEDNQNNIWIGTSFNGAYRFNPNRNRVYFFGQNANDNTALQHGSVFSIAGLDSNTLMIGTASGPSLFFKNTNTFFNFKGHAYNFGNKALERVFSGIKDSRGVIWMGSSRLGLMKYNPNTKEMKVYSRTTRPIPLNDDGVVDMFEIGKDSLMLRSFSKIAILHTQTMISESAFTDTINPLYNLNRVSDICLDKVNHQVWISTHGGLLYLYDLSSKQLIEKTDIINTSPLPNVIHKIAIHPKGGIWLATNIGAILITENNAPKIYTIKGSINTSPDVSNMLPIGDDVWLTNNRSIAKVNTQSGNVILLGQKDGFTNLRLFASSLILSPWNTVLIGSNNGFFEIIPETITQNDEAYPPKLTSFKVNDKPLVTNTSLSSISHLKLNYRQNFFSFTMSAFDFSDAENIEYAYMLEGFDSDWQYIGKNRNGSYTNIPGGTYTLRLKARNSSSEWNENGQTIVIKVGQAFWTTWWFFVLLFLLAFYLVYKIYRSRIGYIRRQEKIRSSYEIKLNELENSALRTQMNPHFVFNSLNTINSFINANESAKANTYISKFAKLIRLILDHSREKKIILADELKVVELYVQLEQIRFQNKFSLEIKIESEIDISGVEIPPLIIQPFVENAILHGLLPLENNGLLRISIKKTDEHILIITEDNGIGRERAKEIRKNNTHRKSHGIGITLKRIELFNKTYNFNGQVKIIDLKGTDNIATGTKVEIPIAFVDRF